MVITPFCEEYRNGTSKIEIVLGSSGKRVLF
jgi:hypothetical protein